MRKATRESLLPIPLIFQKTIFIETAEEDPVNGFDRQPCSVSSSETSI